MNGRFLVICNPNSGKGKIKLHIHQITNKLKEKYYVKYKFARTPEDLEVIIKEDAKDCDTLIICGGDGTFHLIINLLIKYNLNPKIGYLPEGTVCDMSKNLNISKNINKALDAILIGKTTTINFFKANDIYVCYAMATGKYVSTSYRTSSKLKKLGPISYFINALLEVFKRYNLNIKVVNDVGENYYHGKVLMIMNTKSVAGVTLKERESKIVIVHNKMEFNLGNIAFKKRLLSKTNCTIIPFDRRFVVSLGKNTWSVDGEEWSHDGDIELIPNAASFEVIYDERVRKKWQR